MNLTDILNNTNTYIGDSSADRITDAERYLAATEATAWLLEELGNEHMVDRTEVIYLPTVMWYKMDTLTPYLLTAGQLKYKDVDEADHEFTRVEARELNSITRNKQAYAIERYNDDAYLGIVMPDGKYTHKDLIAFNKNDGYTYLGTNAVNILGEKDAIRFDMDTDGVTSTGISTTTSSISIESFSEEAVLIIEVEIPDITDVTSVSIKFGTDLATDYYLGTVAQDVNGNALVVGVNTIKFNWSDLSEVGTPDKADITKWAVLINHDVAKPAVDGFKISDLRIAEPVYLNFKYVFYRVGKDANGDDLIEFSAGTDIPFFINRYPQYRFAVAHKTASVLYKGLRLFDESVIESREATGALNRYRKNFSAEKDTGSSSFKVAGINLRGRRIIRRR